MGVTVPWNIESLPVLYRVVMFTINQNCGEAIYRECFIIPKTRQYYDFATLRSKSFVNSLPWIRLAFSTIKPIRVRFKINNGIIDRPNLSIMKNWEMAGLPLSLSLSSTLLQMNRSNTKCAFIFNFSLMEICYCIVCSELRDTSCKFEFHREMKNCR